MGQRYLLQASVFRATVLFAVLVLIPYGHFSYPPCGFKAYSTTSDITVFVADLSSCNLPNTSTINTSQNSIIMPGLQPGNTYSFQINCSTPCCGNFSTYPAQVENITVVDYSNSTLTLGWVPPPGHVDSYMVNLSELSVPNIFTNSVIIVNLTAGRLYNLSVTSISGGLMNVSNTLHVATKPNPPEALRVSYQTDVSIYLLWSKPLSMDGVTVSYEVSYRSNQSGNIPNFNQTTSLNWTLTNLLSGSQYAITVVTKGVKDFRSSFANLTAYTVPGSVKNLVVSAVSTDSVSLTWVPPSGMSNLFSYSVSITSPDQTLNTTSNSYQITQLQPGTLYNCSVRTFIAAANIFGPSQFVQCNTKPLPVTILTASPVGTTAMFLSWYNQNNNNSLYVYNVSVNGAQWMQANSQNANVSGLTPGTNYTFTVQAVVNGMISDPVVTYAFTGLDKASNISAVGTTQSMRVAWKSPAGNVGLYNVLLNGTVKMETKTNETSVTFTDLLPGTQYSVIVTSISGPINQDSDTVSNATLPTPPGIFSTVQSTNMLNISWARPINMSSVSHYYQLQYSNSTLITNLMNCSQNYTSLAGLSAGVSYNITVRTVGAMGYFSSPQSLTAYTNPSAVSDVRVNGYNETSITLSWKQNDVQQSGYSYLLTLTHHNGTLYNMTVNNTAAQLLSLRSASQYNITIITVTAGNTVSDPWIITASSKPYPVYNVTFDFVNDSAVSLRWARPQEYHKGFSYQILVSNCTDNSRNLSTFSENITVADLQPGTLCQFSLYSLACGILAEPVNISVLTKPSMVVPKVDNQGSNQSLLVTWDHPGGGVDMYILNISSDGWSNSTFLNSNENNHTFTQLKAATVFTVTLTTVKGSFRETSYSVNMATYPNKPGMIKVLYKNNHSVLFQWDEAQDMTAGSFNYSLYWSSENTSFSLNLTGNNTLLLDELQSGTPYNVSLATVGPMELKSESVRYQVTTNPDPVQGLTVYSTTTDTISVVWESVEEVPKYIVSVYSNNINSSISSISVTNNNTIGNLIPSTHYNISVQSSTSDDTKGEAVWLQQCTDAAPVENVICTGPNLTLPKLILSWSSPRGGNQGFDLKLSPSDSVVDSVVHNCLVGNTTNLNYTFTGLLYNTQYSATVWTRGCGKKSTATNITCMTGFTKPVVPKITAVSVSELQYNKFAFIIQPDAFNNSNGTVRFYGVLVSSGSFDCIKDQCLQNTYEDWKAGRCSTFLAVVKESISVEGQTITIGDGTEWKGYKNGELKAKGTYNFAIIAFTYLMMNHDLVDASKSYYSISEIYHSPITLPENPVVIGGAAAGVCVAAVLVVIVIGVVVCRRKQRKEDSISVPIHSIRNKVSDPIKVEDYEAYYRRQRADSFCGFAEEFEDLRPVGINQPKSVALAPENKAKNRYNNVLPYDSSRVKLSVLGSPFDDYINANYMPGYTSKKEFIAAQGPLPCTVNDFWRMIWEKNVHTIVMLTKCNEQGRVKCEEYWPAEMKHFNNLIVTTISEIPLEDWTLRDFEVKNVKTTETRSVRHFHFTAWPDHGVPETTELLINFRHLVREHMDQYSRHSPTLVHCSAGVGRTGTFIAIDRLLFQIERDGIVDVYGIIHDLRMHRPLMVQTEDQYVFLNQCAMDIIKSRTGNNVDLIYQNTAALTIYENFEPLKKAKNGYHKA